MSLFDLLDNDPEVRREHSGWRPQPLRPVPDDITDLEIDLETAGPNRSGLKWWKDGRMIGFSVCYPDGTTEYHPCRHRGDVANHPVEQVVAWFKDLKNKYITNLNSRFDNHFLVTDGIDLEAQGCRWGDVGHQAALLDDHRQKFSLASLCQDYLTDEEKVTKVGEVPLDMSQADQYPAWMMAVRGEADVRQVQKLKRLFKPQLDEQDLGRVVRLEEDVIFAVCEMERNAQPMDVEKLKRWIRESEQDLMRMYYQIYRETGLKVNPDSPADMAKLFKHLGIEVTEFTASGRPSFTDEILERVDNATVQLCRRAGKLADLRSKQLLKKMKAIEPGETVLRYALHQLRTTKDSMDQHAAGTVTGRFSATEIVEGIGDNIQNVLALEKQLDKYGPDYVARELFIAEPGFDFISADAKQIEYRVFASKAGNPKVIKAYQEDPNLSFHKLVHGYLLPLKPDLLYKPLKNLNFAKIYGAGPAKIALMMGYITRSQYERLKSENPRGVPRTHPELAQVREVLEVYDRELPEVQPLLNLASDLAENRGYVRTIRGRRMRFPDKQRTHKALNGVIQGSAADIMKQKMVEVHQAVKRGDIDFIPRMTVHDQITGSGHGEESRRQVNQVLDEQTFQDLLKVPILWDVKVGLNWKECDEQK